MTKPQRKPKADRFGLTRPPVVEVNQLFEEIKSLKRLVRQHSHTAKQITYSAKRIDSLFDTVLDKIQY